MLKWIALLLVLAVIVLLTIAQMESQAVRRYRLLGGQTQLQLAYADYEQRGYITNYPSSGYRVSVSTNVVTMDGVQYPCFAEATWSLAEGGVLAMTTNRIFIWLDPTQPPKIITNGYKPPLFGGYL